MWWAKMMEFASLIVLCWLPHGPKPFEFLSNPKTPGKSANDFSNAHTDPGNSSNTECMLCSLSPFCNILLDPLFLDSPFPESSALCSASAFASIPTSAIHRHPFVATNCAIMNRDEMIIFTHLFILNYKIGRKRTIIYF